MMRRTPPPPKNDPLAEEALGWLVRLHSGEETDEDWLAYHDWKAADPRNAEAAARAEHIWSRLGPALKPPRRAARNVAGALVVLVGFGAAGLTTGVFDPLSGWLADEATGIGETRMVALADGSRVAMDAATSFDIAFTDGERRIRVRGGQVYVEVAPDAARPFTVEAGEGEVRALGTAFNVRTEGGRTEVSVTEHAVRVTYKAAASVDLGEGEGVGYGEDTGLGTPRAVDADEATAWRRGEIQFDNRPLGAVAAEMRRYRRGAVVFTDDALKRLPVTGLFSTRDTDTFFAALERTLPVRVTRLPYLTLIQRDPERPLNPYQGTD